MMTRAHSVVAVIAVVMLSTFALLCSSVGASAAADTAADRSDDSESGPTFSVPVDVTLEARDGFTGQALPASVLPSTLPFYFVATCGSYAASGILDPRFVASLGEDGRYHTDGDLDLGTQAWDIVSKVQDKCAALGEFTLGVRGDFPQPIRSDEVPYYFGRTSQRTNESAVISLSDPSAVSVSEVVLYGYDKVSVTPTAPELVPAASCGLEPTVTIPESEGVAYTTDRDGSTLTVTAAPASSFYALRGTTTWSFDLTPEACPPTVVTPDPPSFEVHQVCGQSPSFGYDLALPDIEGVDYSKSVDGNTLTVTASPSSSGYVLEGTTTWSFDLTPEVCPPPDSDPGDAPPSDETSQSGNEPEPMTTPSTAQSVPTPTPTPTPTPSSTPVSSSTETTPSTPLSSSTPASSTNSDERLRNTGAALAEAATLGLLAVVFGVVLVRRRHTSREGN